MINIKKLKISINDNTYGIDMCFKSGINLIIGENKVGKSTIINAIFYSLGLEVLLGYNNEKALKPSLRESFLLNKEEIEIENSFVMLEIENDKSENITLERNIVGPEKTSYIKVYNEIIDKINDDTKYKEFYLKNDAYLGKNGFFNYLKSFLNIKLPTVERYDGKFTELYFENIFSAFLIEQVGGWSTFLNSSPNMYAIKEHKQRVIEFMLGLDRNEIALKKSSLKTLLKSKEKEWSKTNQIINSFSKDYYLEFSKDYTDYKNFLEKELIEININTVEKTISLNNYIKQKNEELNHIKSNNFYKKESENNNLEEYSAKIKELQEQIIILQNKERKYYEKRIKLKLQRNNIAEELKKIDYEKKVFKDIKRLENSGGKNGVELLSCPYCSNKLSENTFSKEVYTMDVDENIKFLDEKLKLLLITEKVLVEEFSELIGKESVIKTELKLKLKELEILNTNLPKISLQKELYYKEFKIEEELEKIIKVNSELRKIFIEKKELANSINEIRKNLEKLPKDDISEMTKEKLKLFEKTIKEYLKIFNFESIEINRIHISEENYFPRVENFDIRMHISASDFIRLQWAYYISLMELSNLSKKILIFDEPGQQNIDFDSIEKLLLVLKEKKDIQSLVSYAISKQTRFKVIKFLKESKINHILIKGKSIKKISE